MREVLLSVSFHLGPLVWFILGSGIVVGAVSLKLIIVPTLSIF